MSGEVGKSGMDAVVGEVTEAPREDSLANEIDAFLSCVRHRARPTVDGRAGLEAVTIAQKVNDSIQQHLANANALGSNKTR
jgi:predicted dehydrogenase